MAKLEARGLTRHYGGKTAVQDFTHSFAEGKITVLLGPSGSGKSTTLNLLAGLLAPDTGTLFLDGVDITSVPAEKRDFGLIFQNYVLFPHLTVQQNVGFGLRVRGVATGQRLQRVWETLELVRIPHLAKRRVDQISGGEQQRVALARAIAYRPKVLLMDEPLSAIDARLRMELRDEISRLLESLAITTIYVTHDQEEAMSLGNEIIFLNQGMIEQRGCPRDVYFNPENSIVATFLGPANYFPAICLRTDGGWIAQVSFAQLPLLPDVVEEGACRVMFRPEDIEVVEAGRSDFAAIAESVEFLGNRLRVHLVSEECRIILDTGNDLHVGLGARIHCRVKPDKIRIWPVGADKRMERDSTHRDPPHESPFSA